MIYFDIHDGNGVVLGDGPIISATAFEARAKLSAAGDWSASLPASDARAALLTPGRSLYAYSVDANGRKFLGGGPIQIIDRRLLDSGIVALEVTGADLLAELAFVTSGYGEYASGRTALLAAMPVDWTVIETDTIPAWSTRLAHESLLASWIRAANQVGFHFRLNAALDNLRRIQFLTTTPASGVRAHVVPAPDGLDSAVCAVRRLSEIANSWEIVNRLYLYGAGNYATRGTLKLADAWPNGGGLGGSYTDGAGNVYVVDVDESRVDCTSSQAIYGVREAAVQFADIAPLSNSTADMRSAANALLRAALVRMAEITEPQQAYAMEVEALTGTVLVGDTIHVDVTRFVDGRRVLDVQRDLVVLETITSWQADQPVRQQLRVSTTAAMPVSDAEKVAQLLQGTINAAALPQTSASIDTICATDSLDDDADAPFHFWLGEETTIVYQVLMRFRVDPLRSTAKAVGGTVEGDVTLAGHTHDVTIAGHTHGVTIGDHDHGITVHGMADPTSNGLARIVYMEPDNNRFTAAFGDSVDEATSTSDGGGDTVTSASGGSSTPTSASGGGGTFDVDLSSALTLDYGIFEESGANTYGVAAIEWTVNGVTVTESPVSAGSGWYRLDLTSYVVDGSGERPAQDANVAVATIAVAAQSGKTCQITVQIERRTSIQPIRYS